MKGLQLSIAKAFGVAVGDRAIERNVALCRGLLGIAFCHRFLGIVGASEHATLKALVASSEMQAAVLWLLFALGMLTPIVTLAVLPTLFYVTHNLADQIAAIVLWGILLLGCGRPYGIDALLSRCSWTSKLLRCIYTIAPPPNSAQLAWVRALLCTLFWGGTLGAMTLHLGSPIWRNGQILPVVFSMPYFNDHYQQLAALQRNFPKLFEIVTFAGWLATCAWELFLLPLMFCRPGRIFVALFSVVFFGMSLLVLNLGYLPLVEISWFLLIFNYRPTADARCFASMAASQQRVFVPVASVALVTFGCFFGLTVGCGFLGGERGCYRLRSLYDRLPHALFGQNPINVFNTADISAGERYFLVYESDAAANLRRVVPFMDWSGGRLAYLRNDLLLYGVSVPWQRAAHQDEFSNSSDVTLSPFTWDSIRKVARLDACAHPAASTRHYAAIFLKRAPPQLNTPAHWGAPTPVGQVKFSLDSATDLKCDWEFAMPATHWHETARTAEAEQAVRDYLRQH